MDKQMLDMLKTMVQDSGMENQMQRKEGDIGIYKLYAYMFQNPMEYSSFRLTINNEDVRQKINDIFYAFEKLLYPGYQGGWEYSVSGEIISNEIEPNLMKIMKMTNEKYRDFIKENQEHSVALKAVMACNATVDEKAHIVENHETSKSMWFFAMCNGINKDEFTKECREKDIIDKLETILNSIRSYKLEGFETDDLYKLTAYMVTFPDQYERYLEDCKAFDTGKYDQYPNIMEEIHDDIWDYCEMIERETENNPLFPVEIPSLDGEYNEYDCMYLQMRDAKVEYFNTLLETMDVGEKYFSGGTQNQKRGNGEGQGNGDGQDPQLELGYHVSLKDAVAEGEYKEDGILSMCNRFQEDGGMQYLIPDEDEEEEKREEEEEEFEL